MKCIFSVDVEDWFHILDVKGSPPSSAWDTLPSRVERNFLKLLDILGRDEVQATCFFLGWVAHEFPHLVKEAARRGHEVASHGYAHRLVYELTPKEFYQDAVRSKQVLEDIAGKRVVGYRAAGFSVTERTPWFFDQLRAAGYRYDSSVFPAMRGHGGMRSPLKPYAVGDSGASLIEFPATVVRILGVNVCFSGGGYLRLFPLAVIRHMSRTVLREGRPVMFYVHPREIDPIHPRLSMNLARKFKSYVGLNTTEAKIGSLLSTMEFSTFKDYIAEHREEFGVVDGAFGPTAAVAPSL